MYIKQRLLQALIEHPALKDAEKDFLGRFTTDAMPGVLEEACQGITSPDELVEVLKKQASKMHFSVEDWDIFLYSDVAGMLPLPIGKGSVSGTLVNEGYWHPMQLPNNFASQLKKLLQCNPPWIANATRSRCTCFFPRGGAATLKETLRTLTQCAVSCHTWAPAEWKPASKSIPSILPDQVELWRSCDQDVIAYMEQLSDSECLFPAMSSFQHDQGPGDYQSAARAWSSEPTEAVNAGLRLLAYQNKETACQWRAHMLTTRMYPGEDHREASELAAEAARMTWLPHFTLQAGESGDIVSAYDTYMGSQLLWFDDDANAKPPQHTTCHTRCYIEDKSTEIQVGALEIVNIYNGAFEQLDPEVVSAVVEAISRVTQFCLGRGIRTMLFGNAVYTWACKFEGRKLFISRAYPFSGFQEEAMSLADTTPFIGEVVYVISCLAIRERVDCCRECTVSSRDSAARQHKRRRTSNVSNLQKSRRNDPEPLPDQCHAVLTFLRFYDDQQGETQQAAIKLAPRTSEVAAALAYEACVFYERKPLWGKVVPELIAAGPCGEDGFVLGTKLITDARLLKFEDARGNKDLRWKLRDAVYALHKHSVTHNRLNGCHILVKGTGKAAEVFLIDLGWAKLNSSRDDILRERICLHRLMT